MISLLKNIAFKLGIDKSILFTSLARIIQAIGGIVSILFVARYLTETEQGFYYTFGSIVAIQIFFELGLNSIITQYVAHESSNLEWKDQRTLIGDKKYLSRLSSLLHFSIKWYSFFSIALLITLTIIGFLFFNKYTSDANSINWQYPWILLVMGTSLNLLMTPILAFFEGLGKVKEVAKIRLYQQLSGLVIVCGGLLIGAKLFVLGTNWIIGIIIITILIVNSDFLHILTSIWNIEQKEQVDYKKEIFPYQWKIALSWISGYFIFQMFNPVLFAYEGAIVAGQMGMTLAALNGIQSLSMSWISTKVPLFSRLIALKEYYNLDQVFNKSLKQSIYINISLLVFMLIVVCLIKEYHLILNGIFVGDRFLNLLPMSFMMVAMIINQFISSWAIYLRCHKKEPFLKNSIVIGLLCCSSTMIAGKYYGIMGVTTGYCLIIVLFSFPWSYYIFKIKKTKWHKIY